MPKKPTLTAFYRAESQDDLQDLLQDLVNFPSRDNQRKTQRMPWSILLNVEPLDKEMNPIGDRFLVVTRDLSEYGLGFFHRSFLAASFVRLESKEKLVGQRLARVCFNKAFYGERPLYLVGVEFLKRPISDS